MDANRKKSPRLLVSVRSVAEAAAALTGGADLIDVKEPSRGSLGRADDSVIAAVVEHVAGRRPVSAALGELAESPNWPGQSGAGLTFLKWGLAGCHQTRRDWRDALTRAGREVQRIHPHVQVVAVAYADWQAAAAPRVEEVCRFALDRPGSVLLIDTFSKAPDLSTGRVRSLLDWLTVHELCTLCQRCRGAGVRVALAGSLGITDMTQLLAAQPDWFAVRGAACAQGRDSTVCAERVRELAETLSSV
jgi:uncharacterized protein (UPF0264 family)